MYCPECGSDNSNDAIFCSNCGLNLSKIENAEQPETKPSYMEAKNHNLYSNETSFQRAPAYEHLEKPQTKRQTVQKDEISATYIVISAILWPVGVVIWAYLKPRKPEASKKVLIATIFGFFMLVLLLGV